MATIHCWEGGVLQTCGLDATSEGTTCSLLVRYFLDLLRIFYSIRVVFIQPACYVRRFFFLLSGCVVARSNIGIDRVDTFKKGFGLARAK